MGGLSDVVGLDGVEFSAVEIRVSNSTITSWRGCGGCKKLSSLFSDRNLHRAYPDLDTTSNRRSLLPVTISNDGRKYDAGESGLVNNHKVRIEK